MKKKHSISSLVKKHNDLVEQYKNAGAASLRGRHLAQKIESARNLIKKMQREFASYKL